MLYGGDFGDKPNLHAFCMNGIVMCDRSLTPKYYEVQAVYGNAKNGDAPKRAAPLRSTPTSCATLPLTSTAASMTAPTAEEWEC